MSTPPSQSLGVPKEEFLAHVRRSLGNTEKAGGEVANARLSETLSVLESQAAEARQRLSRERRALIAELSATAQLRGWTLRRAANSEEVLGYLTEIARQHGVTQICRTDQAVFADLAVDSGLQNQGIESIVIRQDTAAPSHYLREQIIASGIGLTGADYAVAETGSVVVLPRKGLSRLVSVVPPVHLALVRPEDVVASLDDVFLFRRLEYHRNGGDMGSYLNFITGPSRTADIEMKLVVGVHGPREVHLIMLDQ